MTTQRITTIEYRPFEGFIEAASVLTNRDANSIRLATAAQGERVRRVLGLVTAPIRLDGETLIAEDVAGLIRIFPDLELEIAPKFLGSSWPGWREDFLVVANIARSGQLLIHEGIASTTGARDDLASLVARTFVDLFERSQRQPLRTYRPYVAEEWSVDGEVDPEEIVLPGPDGYHVRRSTLSARNRHNAQIASAARLLAPEVREGVLQRQVRRISQRLGPQTPAVVRPPARVPSRHRRWQQCYDLANEINSGFGVRLAPGRYSSPGYVLTTWLAFEQLLVTALRVGLANAQVTYHPQFELGKRANGTAVTVEPDALARRNDGVLVMIDAKYKGRAERLPSISAADLYEALAFAAAADQKEILLIYPKPTDTGVVPPVGSVDVFDKVTVGDHVVIGATIECRGISDRGGFRSFAHGIASLV